MTNSGVAHFQSGSSLRFPCLRLQHQKSRSLARPKVRKSEERVISDKKNKAIDPRIVWCGHFKALSFQIPDGWPGNRVRRRFPHWLQQVAPRVPAEILEAPRKRPRTFLRSRSWSRSRSQLDPKTYRTVQQNQTLVYNVHVFEKVSACNCHLRPKVL